MRQSIILFIVAAFHLLFASGAKSATIWCNPDNSGTETGAAKIAGYNTLWEAIAAMSSGDEIIIADGDWSTGYSGMVIDSNGHLPPSGTSYSSMSTIRAETDFGAKLPAINAGTGVQYVKIQGIAFVGPGLVYGWTHSKFIRCGFVVLEQLTGNIAAMSFDYGSYNLVEECIAWGGGRYKFLDYHGNNNIYRRCVARHDWYISHDWAGQQSNFRGYGTTNTAWQNCISVDSDREQYQTVEQKEDGDFWIGDQAGSGGNIIDGSIIIKGMYNGYYLGGTEDGTTTVTLKNSIALGPAMNGVATLTGAVTYGNVITTMSNVLLSGYNGPDQHLIYHNKMNGSGNVTSSIFVNSKNISAESADYNYYYNAGSGSYGTHSVNADPLTHGLLYPVRIESGSALASAGSGGGVVGPTIMKKIGVSGTHKDQAGWDTVTTDNLWPFPNEDTIKSLMSTTVAGVSGVYGFTSGTSIDGSPQTLTKYIWEYFGNQIPADIYGSTSSAISPTSFSIPGGVPYGIVQ